MRSSRAATVSRRIRCPRHAKCQVCLSSSNSRRTLSTSSNEALLEHTANVSNALTNGTRGSPIGSFSKRNCFSINHGHPLSNRRFLTLNTTVKSFPTVSQSSHHFSTSSLENQSITPLTARPSLSQASPMTNNEQSSPPIASTNASEKDTSNEFRDLVSTLSEEPALAEPKEKVSKPRAEKRAPGRPKTGARKQREPAKLVTLSTYAPDLLEEFHRSKNKISINDLIPENALVWWICPHGLTFSQILKERKRRSEKNLKVNLGECLCLCLCPSLVCKLCEQRYRYLSLLSLGVIRKRVRLPPSFRVLQ